MDVERQRVLNEILLRLNEEHPSFYYLSAAEIADAVCEWIKNSKYLPKEKLNLVKDLGREDIQYLLSFDEHRIDPL